MAGSRIQSLAQLRQEFLAAHGTQAGGAEVEPHMPATRSACSFAGPEDARQV